MNGVRTILPSPARYLLRIDDLCPTTSRERWLGWRALIEEFQIRPILAIVPDNQDPDLWMDPPDPDFWNQMRRMESGGATLGLHGYRHLCVSRGCGLLPFHRLSEFAGVRVDIQHAWIHEGLRILRGHGLNPVLWVAPRHGLDSGTLQALRAEGIQLISDGLARAPFARGGLIWIPQQLWRPVDKASGLWTICVHPNHSGNAAIDEMRAFLGRHAAQLTSVEQVLAESHSLKLSPSEQAQEQWELWRVRASRFKKRLQSR
jgi:hypothetical protein